MFVNGSALRFRPLPLLAGAALLSLLAAPAAAGVAAAEAPSPALKRAAELYARFRVTLDHGDLEAAEHEIEKALVSAPGDFALRKFRLRILLAHHEFEDMEAEAAVLQRERPDDPELDGALGDAYFDLGRTDEAAAAYDRFASASRSAAAWSRIALVRDRMGDLAGALTAMDLAAGAARSSDPEAFAWCRSRSARLLLKMNRYEEAEGRLVEALRAVPSHAPSLAAAAEIAARKGLWEPATRLAERSLSLSPDLAVAAALVEYRRAIRDRAGEERARALVAELEQCLPEDHKLVHRFLALYLADGPDVARAVAMTARELATRKDPGGYEAWAWALHRAGRSREAASPIRLALASGVTDPLLEFRAGAIFLAAGDLTAARAHLERALAMDPRFHVLHAAEAKQMLESLETKAEGGAPVTASAEVAVKAERMFRDLAGPDTPAHDLVGIANSAAVGVVTAAEIESREIHRPGDVLEAVPGLLVSQHSGEGKANQYYLRGFNLDHGTDVASAVAGVPVNMPTHAHGQGYSDDNFLIPELVSGIQYKKGPYFADEGDFSAAGAVHVDYVRALGKPIVDFSIGGGGYRRGLFADSVPAAGGSLLAALELFRNDGPWTNPDDFRKVNGLLRWSTGDDRNGFSVTGAFYQGAWNSTDQVPRRGVNEGLYGRLDAIDPTDGGRTHRYTLSAEWEATGQGSRTRAQAYAMDYALDLWSNFTYFLHDPVNGDQFQQADRRVVVGGKLSHDRLLTIMGADVEASAGLDVRNDNIPTLRLLHTKARDLLSVVRSDHVSQTSGAAWAQAAIQLGPWFRAVAGLRGDVYGFNIASNVPENSGTDSRGILSPKLSLIVGPFSNTEIYLNGGYGFHSNDGRGATLHVDPVTRDAVEPVTPLVRAKGTEIGLRSTAIKGVQTSFGVWLLDIDSELVFSGDAGITEPSRASRRIGVEWASTWSPLPWMTVDADLAYSRARFTENDSAGNFIPGSIEGVASAGVSVNEPSGFFGSIRLRYFGPRALIEDDSVRSKAATLVNLKLGWQATAWARLTLDVYNVFNTRASDVDYYYASRLPGEPAAGVDDVHGHPVDPRTVRAGLTLTF